MAVWVLTLSVASTAKERVICVEAAAVASLRIGAVSRNVNEELNQWQFNVAFQDI